MNRISANQAYLKHTDFSFYITLFFCIIAFSISALGQTTYYVNGTTGNDSNSGLSWDNSLKTLQSALAKTQSNPASGNQIWVAAGTYYPDESNGATDNDRSAAFIMQNNVAIYGGFSNTGNPSFGVRNWTTNPTILSGEIQQDGMTSNNSYNIIFNNSNGLNNTAILDGFTISGGKADGGFPNNVGGGIYNNGSSPFLSNCLFENNEASIGGAMCNNASSMPTLTNCIFRRNVADGNGGGLFNNFNSHPILKNCLFIGNKADDVGGGIYNSSSAITLVNCTLEGNESSTSGGGIYNLFSTLNITNSLLWNNKDNSGTGTAAANMVNDNGTLTTTYSFVQGHTLAGTGNLAGMTDPLLVQASVFNGNGTISIGDAHLQATSPVINMGDNTAIAGITTDLDGNSRTIGNIVDMGVYEKLICPINNIIYVNKKNTGGYDGSSWATAIPNLQTAINVAKLCPNVPQIWVAAGTYLPTEHNPNQIFADGTVRGFTFYINKDIAIYGGFAGTETALEQRNIVANKTILSGDVGTPNDNSDNSSHVLFIEGTTTHGAITHACIIDGFTISGGNARFADEIGSGGGLFNLAFETGTSSSPTIRNCIFRNNSGHKGGAVGNLGLEGKASPHFINVLFNNNSAEYGGAVMNYSLNNGTTAPLFLHTTFYKNISTENEGGGIFNDNSEGQNFTTIFNSIFWNNGPSISNSNGTVVLAHSLVEEANCDSLKNSPDNIHCTAVIFNQYPLFEDTINLDLRLKQGSPAIDAGIDFIKEVAMDLGITIDSIQSDLAGTPRKLRQFDMGAYENQMEVGETTIYHVNHAMGNDSNDGLSWETALKTLQTAIDRTRVGVVDQIWVAQGTYVPTSDNPVSVENSNRDLTFYINKDIAIYGGFAGTETDISERNPTTNITTLSGDIGVINDSTDNAFHVLYLDGTTTIGAITSACVIDGFTIEKGNANGNGNPAIRLGGGIYNKGNGTGNSCSPTISYCNFSRNTAENSGGAIFNESNGGGVSNPIITYCNFSNNVAKNSGGAIFNQGTNDGTSNPTITYCNFSGNTVTNWGGAIYTQGEDGTSSPNISHCVFANNTATTGGAIFLNGQGDIKAQFSNCLFQNNGQAHIGYVDGTINQQSHFKNCTFSGATTFAINIENWGGGTPIDFTNCIFWNNNKMVGGNAGANDRVNIYHSIVEESAFAPANNNIHQDPLFVDAANGNFRQQTTSPAINAGTTIAGITSDLDGQPRPFNGQFDMGPYEIQLGTDGDMDGVVDSQDLCNGGNDRMNSDGVGMPDDCDCNPTSAADDNMVINSIIIQDTVKSSFTITSVGTVNSGTTTLFQAGHSITLKAGFTAHAGSDFTAKIDYCRTPPAQLTEEELAAVARTSNEETEVLITEETIVETEVNNINNANELMTIDWWTGPNPFRQAFTIQTTLSKDAESISVLVYDQTGRLANAVIFETPLTAGTYEWQVDGASIPLGMAYVILQVGDERLVKKVIRVE